MSSPALVCEYCQTAKHLVVAVKTIVYYPFRHVYEDGLRTGVGVEQERDRELLCLRCGWHEDMNDIAHYTEGDG